MSDADQLNPSRRMLLAGAGPLAAICLAAGSTVGPRLADTVSSDKAKAAAIIAAVTPERTAAMWAGFLLIVGLLLLIPFFAGVSGLIRRRGATLATIGGTLAMAGAACGAVSQWFFFSEYQLTAPGVPSQAGAIGLSALPGVPAGVLFLTFFGGLTLGWLLLAVAAWRSGLFVSWHVLAFAAAGIALTVSHSAYTAAVIAVAAVVLAPTIAGRRVAAPA